ncbi:MAG TPA: LuxR C-terminal-related transcriptional regulator [Actinomycetota bacterium]|nr:LuxR C-terminal-related transcriptional regulator [Actinomycetota bacterium]
MRDDEEQARHIALGSAGPDAEDAKALEAAARQAYLRGAPDAAAELWELSRRSTPVEDGDGVRRRGTYASACAFDAGDVAGARLIADQLLSVSPPGEARADIFDLVSSFAWYDVVEIRSLLKSGIEEAPDPSGVLSAMTADLGWVEIVGGDVRDAVMHTRRAIEIGERSGDRGAVMVALIAAAHAEFMLGRDPTGLLERAIDLERGNHLLSFFHANPRNTLGATLMWAGDLAGARRVLEQYYKETTDQGRYTALGDVLVHLAELESRAGDYRRALAYADELLEMTVEAGYEGMRELGLWARALAEAHLGDVKQARKDATEGLAVAQRHGDLLHVITNRSVLGFLDVSLGELDSAVTFLAPLPGLLDSRGIVEPGIYPFVPDAVEALTGTGRVDRAREVLEPYERLGHELDRPLVIATAARCRGLLAAADGGLDEALSDLEHAIDAHERVQQPFELARTLLILGEVRRRAKQKRPAREALDQAVAIFDELGAPIWSARARASLARISGRSASAGELTETERQVAHLAAEGKTNREVAEALFVSQKTVEANLSRAYRKLGIRSRRQLAERLDAL